MFVLTLAMGKPRSASTRGVARASGAIKYREQTRSRFRCSSRLSVMETRRRWCPPYNTTVTTFSSVLAKIPDQPSSRPMPLSLKPPHGKAGSMAAHPLIQTAPALI